MVIGEPRVDAVFVELVITWEFPNRFPCFELPVANPTVLCAPGPRVDSGDFVQDLDCDATGQVAIRQIEEIRHTKNPVDNQSQHIQPCVLPEQPGQSALVEPCKNQGNS